MHLRRSAASAAALLVLAIAPLAGCSGGTSSQSGAESAPSGAAADGQSTGVAEQDAGPLELTSQTGLQDEQTEAIGSVERLSDTDLRLHFTADNGNCGGYRVDAQEDDQFITVSFFRGTPEGVQSATCEDSSQEAQMDVHLQKPIGTRQVRFAVDSAPELGLPLWQKVDDAGDQLTGAAPVTAAAIMGYTGTTIQVAVEDGVPTCNDYHATATQDADGTVTVSIQMGAKAGAAGDACAASQWHSMVEVAVPDASTFTGALLDPSITAPTAQEIPTLAPAE